MLLWLALTLQSSEPGLDSGIRRLFVVCFSKPQVFFVDAVVVVVVVFFNPFVFGKEHPQVATCTCFKLRTDKNTGFDVAVSRNVSKYSLLRY